MKPIQIQVTMGVINRHIKDGIVAHSVKARIMESQQLAVTRQRPQQRNGVSCTVRADSCTCNSGIRHAITKQQLHCNGGTISSMWSVPGIYN